MKPVLALLKKEFLFSKWCILFIVLINLLLGLCYAFFPLLRQAGFPCSLSRCFRFSPFT